jgi:Cu-Zn family superoxide dismutase
MKKYLILLISLLLSYSCNQTKKKSESIHKYKISLNSKNDSGTSGLVTIKQVNNGKVELEAHIMGLNPGNHAIHIHEKADCSSADGKSAGGHWNPTFENHGSWGNSKGFHRGDIGNFIADENGHGMMKFATDLWCLNCDDPIKNIIGKSIIIHDGEDDLISQPSGAAGARVSCAGIINDF